jgi:hypothetical protein
VGEQPQPPPQLRQLVQIQQQREDPVIQAVDARAVALVSDAADVEG